MSSARRWQALASFWIGAILVLASLILVVGYLVGAPLFYGTATIPPAFTTSLAFLLLGNGLILFAASRAWEFAGREDLGNARLTAILSLTFIILVAGILGAGYLFGRQQQRQFRSHIEDELAAIADLKVNELRQWRSERLGEASFFYKNEQFSQLTKRLLNNPGDRVIRQQLQTWMKKIVDMPHYRAVYLADTSGSGLITLPAGQENLDPQKSAGLLDALQSKTTTLVDFYNRIDDTPPCLDLVVPILADDGWQTLLGSLVIRIDPANTLYPLITNWPTSSPSAEALIIRRQGENVLYLNELRFQKDSALSLRLPLSRADLPSAMAVSGKTGIVQGRDYREVPVLAALRSIPESPWFLVARIDLAEITEPLRERLYGLTGIICSLLLGTGAVAGFIWRNQRARFYRLHYLAARELEVSEKRMRLIFENSKDGILVVDKSNRKFIIANQAICAMLGYNLAEMLKKGVQDIHPPSSLPMVIEQFERQARGETSVAANTPMLRKDGTIFYADIHSTPIELGGRACMLGTFRDITDRMIREARIDHLNRVLRAIRNVNQLIVKAESVEELIEKACTILINQQSYTSAMIITTDGKGRPISHAEADRDDNLQPLTRDIAQGRLPRCCEMLKEREGACVICGNAAVCDHCPEEPVCLSAQKMSIGLKHQQTIYGYLIVSVKDTFAIDSDEENLFCELAGDLAYCLHNMALKKSMQKTEIEKENLAAQFYQAQKMEAVGQLAGGVAHDFNNLLSIILGYIQLLENNVSADPDAREAVEEIHNAGIRARDLTRQLLAFSRKQVLEMKVVDINKVIGGFDKLIRRTIGEDIELQLVLCSNQVQVKADISQLEQILMNLAVNARDAMPDGGRLAIETARVDLDEEYAAGRPGVIPGPYAMLAVSDSGAGMSEETRARIFEPFFTTKPLGKGTGLGLATVYGIAKQHGGNIWVYSEPGQGTTFKIYLPLVTDESDYREEIQAEPKTASGGQTILVVEDEPSLRKLAGIILKRHGYTVLVATDGNDAVDIARSHTNPIHLLLTDVIMPKMKGTEVFTQVRQFHPEIRVLYMSGYSEEVVARQGVLNKGISFLQKPFTADSLKEKIAETLRG